MSDPTPQKRKPFECQRCNTCCQGRGAIFLEPEQIGPAARILGLEPDEFTLRYCRKKDGRWEVRAGQDGACILLGPEGCTIHQAKPDICRRWPFFDNILERQYAFEEARLSCPGIDPDCSFDEFLAYARELGYLE